MKIAVNGSRLFVDVHRSFPESGHEILNDARKDAVRAIEDFAALVMRRRERIQGGRA